MAETFLVEEHIVQSDAEIVHDCDVFEFIAALVKSVQKIIRDAAGLAAEYAVSRIDFPGRLFHGNKFVRKTLLPFHIIVPP
jgi:hypothetical protein